MKKIQSQEDRYYQMMTEPVDKLIIRMAVPTITSMLVTSIYNMADTFFVSQINTSASAAVGIIFSLMSMVQALAFMIGMGSGNHIARLLGQQKREKAEIYASVGFFTEFLLGIFLAAMGLLCLEDLVFLLGSTESIAPYAMDYARYILCAAPFMMCSFGMNNMLRFQGNAFYAAIGITSGGILNIILDPLFIFGLDLGISGAALATALSQIVSFGLLLYQSNHMRNCLSIRLSYFKPSKAIYQNILHEGMPSLARQGIASLAVIILNFSAHPYGDAAIAAMSIVNRFTMFMNSAIIGFGQGFQPVCGFNFGAGKYRRVIDSYRFCLRVSAMVLLGFAIISFVFAEPIITVFRREDTEVIRIGTLALQMQAVAFPLVAQITMSNMLTQTIGYGVRATIIASLRQGICLIPLLAVLPSIAGLLGIQLAQPLSDLISAVIAFTVTARILQELKEMEEKSSL